MTMGMQHPEEALDRVLSGTASAQDKAVVNEHLATCLVCALQLRVARANAAEDAALAAIAAAHNERVVSLAMAEVRRKPAALVRLARLPRPAFLAACLLLLAGVAAAAAWIVRDGSRPPSPSEPPRAVAAVVSSVPMQSGPAIEPPSPAPVTSAESVVAERAAPKPSPVEPTASALFDQGRALRAQRKRAAAISVFEKLQRAYPDSRESRLSYALVGRLLLEERRPAEALVQFDRHLTLRGDAEQEALAGRASAYQQMGRGADESNAWSRLLAAHPNSIYAGRAKQRLEALTANP
ncbi:MAG TPA: tetratricopeptide repeat protein [Polyangiaceae bacterium]|nr:tetratricopeptide repeat protein [Polyangiaceae bacterium]